MAVGTYNPAQASVRDRIRAAIADIGDNTLQATPVDLYEIADESYDTAIDGDGATDWRLAAATMADQLAAIYNARVTSFSRAGGISVSWSNRAANLYKQAEAWRLAVVTEASADRDLRSLAPERETDGPYSEYTRTGRYERW